MKIGILEVKPRINGAVAFTLHLRQGFRDLGHSADLVAFTKSGKPLSVWGKDVPRYTESGLRNGWWAGDVDRVISTKDLKQAARELSEYDLIVMTEPKSPDADRHAEKHSYTPEYIKILEQVTSPWTSVLHGPQYDPQRAPFMPRLLRTPTFTGVLSATHMGYYDYALKEFGAEALAPLKEVTLQPDLPYEPLCDMVSPAPEQDSMVIGMTARIVPNKGQLPMCMIADRLYGKLALHGVAAHANRASPSGTLWERLIQKHGFENLGVPPNVFKVEPWTVRHPNGAEVSYHGEFWPDDGTYDNIGVHVSLTSRKYAYGHPEYVSLEAIDHGAIPVWPSSDDPLGHYSAFRLDSYQEVRDHDPEELVRQVNEAWEQAKSLERDRVVLHNRHLLRTFNRPSAYAVNMLLNLRIGATA